MSHILIVLFAVDMIGTLLGICTMRSRRFSGKFATLSAGVMVGVALFWILPDMTRDSGVAHGVLTVGVSITLLYAFDRYVYPVCPCCAHREHSKSSDWGSLVPLVTAILIHNLFDGWTAAVAVSAGAKLQSGIDAGLLAHKVPEAILFGLILRGVTNRPLLQTISAAVTSIAILVGGALYHGVSLLFEEAVLAVSLSFACGSFLFVGAHAFLRQQRHVGIRAALKPLILGLLLSALPDPVVSATFSANR